MMTLIKRKFRPRWEIVLIFSLLSGAILYLYPSLALSTFVNAVERGDVTVATVMLRLGANPNVNGNSSQEAGRPLLIQAVVNGQTTLVEALLRYGAEVDAVDKSGSTALLWAVEKGHIHMLPLLFDAGSDIASPRNRYAINIAVNRDRPEALKILLANGADANVEINEGETPLFFAVRRRNEKIISQLKRAGAKLTLHGASQLGDTGAVRSLLNAGGDVNSRGGKGNTPLILASGAGHDDTVQELLKRHAKLDLRNLQGYDALWIASQRGHTRIVEMLIDHNANVNNRYYSGMTALMIATVSGHAEVVKVLLEHGADASIEDAQGNTALSLASRRPLAAITSLLREGMPSSKK